jgi:hypothetical protein
MIEIRRGFGPWRTESLNFEEKGRKYREQNKCKNSFEKLIKKKQ